MHTRKFFNFFYFGIVILFTLAGLLAGVFYYRIKLVELPVPIIEADPGPRKIRYLLATKSQDSDTLGKELYESLQSRQERNKAKHQVNVLNLAEKPLAANLKLLPQKQSSITKDLISNKGWTVHFEQERKALDLDQSKKCKFYRIRVATVKSPDQASIVWAAIKSKNPIVFEKCKFLIDKKSLPNGSIIYCLALGEYKTPEETYAMLSSLRSVGQKAYSYEVLK
jgi:hypothetical protein